MRGSGRRKHVQKANTHREGSVGCVRLKETTLGVVLPLFLPPFENASTTHVTQHVLYIYIYK